jgi:hypothetical protein
MINIQKNIEEASQVVGRRPLYSFVTSNPLSGYEGMPFEKQFRHFLMRMFSRIHGIPSSMGKG